ncbi:MAG TPA: TA system VapC family ribonuclease toxin [Gemmatimonadota bacterium]|nr:TA system VapC family ribonuclease toxin [Gemmatimonadota bacterium]
MRAVDTNVLVAGHVETVPEHETAHDLLILLAQDDLPWAIPWPCVYEFLRVTTHPRIFHPTLPLDHALRSIRALLESPTLLLLSETPRHAEVMERVVAGARATGNLVHDAHIAALCLEHGVREILTGDRDFSRFEGLTVTNPFS